MTHSSPSRSRKASGFTLIELMVVMMILGILVAMAVGIGNIVIEGISRTETAKYQQIVISAVGKFHGIKGRLPKRLETSWESVAGLNYGDNPDCRMRTLVHELSSVQACADIYAQLPQRAFESAGTGTTGDVTAEYNTGYFIDAYGQAMDWDPTGGHGGSPALISAGPDGDFGHYIPFPSTDPATPPKIAYFKADYAYTPAELDAQADNVRSDERTRD